MSRTALLPVRGRPRAEQAGQVDERILEAAWAVLLEVGPEVLTLDRVAAAARASKQTIYARHDGKLALLHAVLASRVSAATAGLDILAEAGTAHAAFLDLLLRAVVAFGQPEKLMLDRVIDWIDAASGEAEARPTRAALADQFCAMMAAHNPAPPHIPPAPTARRRATPHASPGASMCPPTGTRRINRAQKQHQWQNQKRRRRQCKKDIIERHNECIQCHLRIHRAIGRGHAVHPAAIIHGTIGHRTLDFGIVDGQCRVDLPVVKIQPLVLKTGDSGKADRRSKVTRHDIKARRLARILWRDRGQRDLLQRQSRQRQPPAEQHHRQRQG